MALVKSGKKCMDLVRNVSSDIANGEVAKASHKLDNLKKDGLELAKLAEQRARVFEKVETSYWQQAEQLQREIGQLSLRESKLNENKIKVETKLETQESELQRKLELLSDSRRRLSEAEEVRQEKEEAERTRRNVGRTVGTVVGIFSGPVGWFAGGHIGESVGQMLNEIMQEEATARREVEDRQRDCDSAKSDVTSLKKDVRSLQSQIRQLSVEIAHKTSQRLEINQEAKKIKETVEFFRRASFFWREFIQFTDDGVDYTTLIQNIISTAEEIGDMSCLYGDASEAIAMPFIEAWEMMETKLNEGSIEFAVRIEVICEQCTRRIKHFPHLNEDNEFICQNCYTRISLQY